MGDKSRHEAASQMRWNSASCIIRGKVIDSTSSLHVVRVLVVKANLPFGVPSE